MSSLSWALVACLNFASPSYSEAQWSAEECDGYFEDEAFKQLPIDAQLDVYLCGRRWFHPRISKEYTLVEGGEAIIPAVLDKLHSVETDIDRESLIWVLAVLLDRNQLPNRDQVVKRIQLILAATPVTHKLRRAQSLDLVEFLANPGPAPQCEMFEPFLRLDPGQWGDALRSLDVGDQIDAYLCAMKEEPPPVVLAGWIAFHKENASLLTERVMQRMRGLKDEDEMKDLVLLLQELAAYGNLIGDKEEILAEVREMVSMMTHEHERVLSELWLGGLADMIGPRKVDANHEPQPIR